MGLNLDLTKMISVPNTLICPRCRRGIDTNFDDYDVECGNPNPSPGIWALDLYCNECDHEWTAYYEVCLISRRSIKR